MEDLEIRKYLQGNVMPLILEGMELLARKKPENPIEIPTMGDIQLVRTIYQLVCVCMCACVYYLMIE